MDLQVPTLYPASATTSASDTVELLAPRTASLAKIVVALRPLSTRAFAPVEMLLPDERADLSPSQSVERKLTGLVKGASIPVSHFRHKKTIGRA